MQRGDDAPIGKCAMATLQQADFMQVDRHLLTESAALVLVSGRARSFDSLSALAWSGFLIVAPVLTALVAQQGCCRLSLVLTCPEAGRHREPAGCGGRSAFSDCGAQW